MAISQTTTPVIQAALAQTRRVLEPGEIDKLCGPHFTITSLAHTLEEELLGGRCHGKAHWKVERVKEG